MTTQKFWGSAPNLAPKPTEWKPGEKRAYIPTLTFGRPHNVPAAGEVGKTIQVSGQETVHEVIRGKRTQGHITPRVYKK